MPAPKIVFLTGAPSAASLEPSSYLDDFSEPFHTLISSNNIPHDSPLTSSTQPSHATWRSLPLTRQPLQTGLTPVHFPDEHSLPAHHNDFFNSASILSSFSTPDQQLTQPGEDAQGVLSQFYEQSLALHDSIPSSQLDAANEDETTTFLDQTSFLTSTSSLSNTTTTTTTTTHPPAPPVIPPHLSDLEDVPTAAQLLALAPQTITLNLIAGILSIAQPRTVTTRWGKTLSLVEILLGDDTRSGFSVTFWLSGDSSTANTADMTTKTLRQLRRQDVVLLHNVALHVFRAKVYGQSLRRGQTRAHVLWRRRGSGGCYSSRDLQRQKQDGSNPQLEKTARVKDWVLRFVGTDTAGSGGKTDVLKGWDRPPDDTQ